MRQLAGDLGVSATYLHDVLHGKRPASLALRIKLAGRLGWNKTSDLLAELLPDDAAKAWKEWDDKTTKQLGEAAEKKLNKKEQKAQKDKQGK
jgi:transcriptional regulator with XRE-family HTH domain